MKNLAVALVAATVPALADDGRLSAVETWMYQMQDLGYLYKLSVH